MSSPRDRTLQAAIEASGVRAAFPLGARTSFDVVRAATEMGYPVLFRPTKNLLGATVVTPDDAVGILVTTNRGLATQRFTLAHELGHILLRHDLHFDAIQSESDLVGWARSSPDERWANLFASELLTPRSAILRIAEQHDWSLDQFRDPSCIYQLSLRLGVSFAAACWGLRGSRLIDGELATRIVTETSVRDVKRSIAPTATITDPWADVWRLTESDTGTTLEAGPNDVFVIRLTESASGGFLWDSNGLGSDFEILTEGSTFSDDYGGDSARLVSVRVRKPGHYDLRMRQKRPWNEEIQGSVSLSIVNFGKEETGFPRVVKHRLISGGSAS